MLLRSTQPTTGSDYELRAALADAASLSLRPAALLMTCVYVFYSVGHLFSLPPNASFIMSSVALATSLVCLWAARWRSSEESTLRSHDVMGLLVLAVLVNIGTHMALLGDQLQTTHFALVIVGFGFMFLDRIWFFVSLVTYLAAWMAIFFSMPSVPNREHFVYLIAVSTVMSIAVHVGRYRIAVMAESGRLESDRSRRDVELKMQQQQAQLAHVSRLITMGELVAGIAHELNQPLSAIANYTSACKLTLTKDEVDAASVCEQVERIEKSAVRAGEIIHRVRGLTSNATSVRPGVDLGKVIRESAELVTSNLSYQKARLRFELADSLAKVSADEIQLQQVVINLMQNGFDSLRDQDGPAEVVVRSFMSKDGPQVSVVDNGPGVASNDANSIFEAFYTTKKHGMGMGLAICRSIIENHGGRIWCETEGVADRLRTSFHFFIPGGESVGQV